MDPQQLFSDFLQHQGLHLTTQRREVLEAFWQADHHVSVEQLVAELRSRQSTVGQTTVYRTLKLLVECGLAEEHNFDATVSVFERVTGHHEHLICTACHHIQEFAHEELELLKEAIARSYGFTLQRHTLHLYGVCSGCQAKESSLALQVV
ncbi:MAG: fur [Cyanobacteria bacterium RYN_339]|nr:fur [Cyanobacteria bacterium RYN_339]